MNFGHVYCVFQPHTYSRTAELFDDFADSLAHKGIAEIILAPIYSARETNTYNVASEDLCNAINERGVKCRFIGQFEDIADYLNKVGKDGDMLLIMGAGDITKVINHLQ